MKEEYITITEFAKRAGVSHQAVYKRLDKDLQPWLQVAQGKKTLNIKALELFEVDKSATDSTEVATIKLLQKTVELLEKELAGSKEQLESKDRQIEQLQKQIADLTAQLLSLSDKVGSTLQAISQTQLADRLLEGQQSFIDGARPKRRWPWSK